MDTQATGKKWSSGQSVAKGDYIQPKIVFAPEVISNEYNGVTTSFTQLHKYYKGAGRFKSGLPIGHTDKGEPITLYIDVRIGKLPKANKSSDAIGTLEL